MSTAFFEHPILKSPYEYMAFAEFRDSYEIKSDFEAKVAAEFEKLIESTLPPPRHHRQSPMKKPEPVIISTEAIAPMVHWLRHEKIMLDSDLAELYGVTTGNLNKAVQRNIGRFPADFMFQLTAKEMNDLRSQTVILKNENDSTGPANSSQTVRSSTLKSQSVIAKNAESDLVFQSGISKKHGGRRTLPYAFTEQGVAMLSSVLRSQRAVEVNIAIMRTFVQLRRLMDSNRDLARKIGEMEEKYDGQFRIVFDAIRQLISPPTQPARELGFHTIQPPKPTKKATRRTKS